MSQFKILKTTTFWRLPVYSLDKIQKCVKRTPFFWHMMLHQWVISS